MKKINELYSRKERPIRIMQFGEGNFLRAFVDYGIDVANEERGFDGNAAVIVPLPGPVMEHFAAQDNLYTVCLRGQKNGKPYREDRVVTSVARVLSAYEDYDAYMALAQLDTLTFIVSNTTEAGIVYEDGDRLGDRPPKTFPAKLTQFLYARWRHYGGAADKAPIMLPVELIDHNGENLRKCVLQYTALWGLEAGFRRWLEEDCIFASTLVDRIVTGYPRAEAAQICAELGYQDALLDQAEPFGLWVIGDARVAARFPVSTEKWQVEFTDRIEMFKERKVRILNGAHTSMVLGAYLAGLNYVGECMADPLLRRQLKESVFDEIVPTVHMPRAQAEEFAHAVFERFENPFVKHALLSISLNSIAKWRARVLPTLKDSAAAHGGWLPKWLTYSYAALLAFYHTQEAGDGCLVGRRGAERYEIHDDQDKLSFIKEHAGLPWAEYAAAVMQRADWWGEDLTAIPGFAAAVTRHLEQIAAGGMRAHLAVLCAQD